MTREACFMGHFGRKFVDGILFHIWAEEMSSLSQIMTIGVATGGGDASPSLSWKFWGTSPEIAIFKRKNMNICLHFQIIQYFQNKVEKSEQKSDFGLGSFDSPEFVPLVRPPVETS